MNEWTAPQRPSTYAEHALIGAILDGTYPPGQVLPGERELALKLGVTRPTVREALQRLSRDGWVTIHQGKATLVNHFWLHGGLNLLSSLVQHRAHVPVDFIKHLLAVRCDLAPSYARAAIQAAPEQIASFLQGWAELEDSAAAFAAFDWQLHRQLTIASGNPIYTLILNGFAGFYGSMAGHYFAQPVARAASRSFYTALHQAAQQQDALEAEHCTRSALEASLQFWHMIDLQQST